MNRPSTTRYTVLIENGAPAYYENRDAALDAAARAVYLSPVRRPDMEQLLDAGRMAEWSYGFSSVAIFPPLLAEAGAHESPPLDRPMETQAMNRPSTTRYTVLIENGAPAYYENRDAALDAAARAVYLSPVRRPDMEQLLDAGRMAEWSYGFSSVAIFPPQGKALLTAARDVVDSAMPVTTTYTVPASAIDALRAALDKEAL